MIKHIGALAAPCRFSRALRLILVSSLVCAALSGCVTYYEPVPAYYPGGSNFDRAWTAALDAAQEAGVRVTSADPASGLIRGIAPGIDVVVTVGRQADGSVRVQFNAKGPEQQDPGLADRFSRAFDRRMGR